MLLMALAPLVRVPPCKSDVVFSMEPQIIDGHIYNILQGGCSDGKNMYICLFERQPDNKTPSGYCAIYKIDMTDWVVTDSLAGVKFGHVNGCCVDDKGVLYVCDEQTLHIVDTESMLHIGDVDVPYNAGAIAFDRQTALFYIRHKWGYYVCDRQFNIVQGLKELDGFVLKASCGIDIDADGMYLNQYINNNGKRINYLSIFSRDGVFRKTLDLTPFLNDGPRNEVEFGFRQNGYFYQGCYRTNNGGVIYKLKIDNED